MRVLQLGPFPPPHGGVQTNLVAIREFLRRRGIPCAVVNITRTRRPDADDVYYPRSAWGVARLLSRLRYDVLHLHIGGHLSARLLALSMVCCSVPGKKAVLTFHSGGYPYSVVGRAPDRLRGFVLRRFDRVIAVNEEIAAFFERCGVPPARIRLIRPHALSAPPNAELSPALRAFFDAHQPVLLSVGLLEPEYDLPLQIEALGMLRARFPNAGLALIGSGSLEEELRLRITTPHILLCGDVEHAVTLRAIERCDVFLRTTLYDGDSISVREALHLGVPVIATDNRMRPPGCELIPASNLAALCEAIERRLTQPRGPGAVADTGEANLEAVLAAYRETVPQIQPRA